MSFMDMILGGSNNLTKKDIAFDMMKESKTELLSLALFAARAINPDLRERLNFMLDSAIKDYFELADLSIRKGWYPAYDTPQEQLVKAFNDSENLSSGR